MKETWKTLLQKGRSRFSMPAVAVLAVGCLLLLLPTGGTKAAERVEKAEEELFDLEQFERRLEGILSRIEGAGETKVVLSLDSGQRKILAQDRNRLRAERPYRRLPWGVEATGKWFLSRSWPPDFAARWW